MIELLRKGEKSMLSKKIQLWGQGCPAPIPVIRVAVARDTFLSLWRSLVKAVIVTDLQVAWIPCSNHWEAHFEAACFSSRSSLASTDTTKTAVDNPSANPSPPVRFAHRYSVSLLLCCVWQYLPSLVLLCAIYIKSEWFTLALLFECNFELIFLQLLATALI